MIAAVNGQEIYYNEYGSSEGLPVVFIHGFPLNRTMWEPQLRALPDSVWAIVYDVRGHGKSSVGDGQYSIEFFVDDLIGLLDHLKIEQAVACGLSMGGYISLRAVERHPERFKGLILCDTRSSADTKEGKIKRADAIKSIKALGVDEFADGFVKSILAEETFEKNVRVAEVLRTMIHSNDHVGICGTLLALAARTDTTDALTKITMPVLILVGEHDKLASPEVSHLMHEKIPEAELHVIPGAGHMSNMENPEVFNDLLYRFLSRF